MTEPTTDSTGEPCEPALEPSEPLAETPVTETPTRTRFAEPVAQGVTEAASAPVMLPVPETPVPDPQEAVQDGALADLPAVHEISAPEADAAVETSTLERPPVDVPVVPVTIEVPEPVLVGASSRSPGGGRGLVVALALLVALLTGLTGFLGWKTRDGHGVGAGEAARQPALQAVRSAAVLLFSYDYRHLAADFKAGRATTTGAFQGEYDKTTDKLVKDVAPRYKAVVIAAVSEASVVSASADKVVTLVFLNQQSSSTLTAAPKVTQSRLLMTLVRKNGTWLVSDISPR